MLERVFRVIQAFVGGVLIAMLASIAHGEFFPWALVVSLVTVIAYLTALRLLNDDKIVTVSGAIAILVTVLIFAQRSTGGSVLIQGNLAGTVWVFGSAVIAGMFSVWPQIRFRPRD